MYITLIGKVEEVDESSYTVQTTGEVVSKIQLSLVIPGMRERLMCELPLDAAPKPATLEQWEMDETWVVVSSTGLRALGFARTNARAGEKAVGAMVVFQASEVREASQEERKKLQEARKAEKVRAKQRRAERRAEKEAAKQVEQAAASAESVKQSA
jgi:hypothetical protein